MEKQKMIDVLRYWHVEEFLLPQTLEEPQKLNNTNQQAFTGDMNTIFAQIKKLQLENELNKGVNNFIWEFVIYGGIYKIEQIKEILLDSLKVEDDYEERVQKGQAASYAIMFNSELKYKIDSVQISTAPWAIKDIVKNKKLTHLNYIDFQSLEEKIKEDFNEESTLDDYEFSRFVKGVNRGLIDFLELNLIESYDYFQVVAKRKMRKNIQLEESDTDLLNSFYIEDLNATIRYIKNGGNNKLLNQYLEMDTIGNRKDIRQDIEYVYDKLSPSKLPDGCWATAGGYPLVYSQQFAINSIKERLFGNGGIYAVNGPPGTGKTTMLRDLIASVITERAKEIAKLNHPKDMFVRDKADKAWKNNDDQQWYRKLKSEFLGYEIVVASSNNGAVENITMEIPSAESVDEKWLEEINYFPEIGSGLIGEEAWGSAAACLGNSSNKSQFVSNFWYGSKTEEDKNIEGFSTYLKNIIDNNQTEEVLKNWKSAKQEFLDTLNQVEKLKKEKMVIKELPNIIQKEINILSNKYSEKEDEVTKVQLEIEELEKKNNQYVEIINNLNQQMNTLENNLLNKQNSFKSLESDASDLKAEINEWYIRKPSIIDIIFTFGKSWRKWNSKKNILEGKEEKLELRIKEFELEIKDNMSRIEKEQLIINKHIEEQNILKEKLETVQNRYSSIKIDMKNIKKEYLIKRDEHAKYVEILHKEEKRNDIEEDREKASPWTHDKDFQDARTKVFISALNLHKALIDANAREIRLNLFRMMEVLGNKVKKGTKYQEPVRHAWATLFLCVPVVSTTFASFGRLFSQLWDDKIGWLLIDEAGQASSKAAVGAMMRSKRAVVVGDPLQLEPIIGLPGSVQNILHTEINAHDRAFSEHTSVQKRTDFTEVYGTYLESGEGGDATWVGSPLRVHRRCHSPMFDISNVTTYKGLMIQGKGKDNCTLPVSTWLDIPFGTNNGHWIEEEGIKAIELVQELLLQNVDKNDIYLISPFRDVVMGLKNIFSNSKLIDVKKQIGTIHTVQGKEAKAVILVLGSDPNNDGARLWVASKPNLLNVAATRAKDRLYIIGNKNKWKDKQYFSDAVELLGKNDF